jgi:hypothetical protein
MMDVALEQERKKGKKRFLVGVIMVDNSGGAMRGMI